MLLNKRHESNLTKLDHELWFEVLNLMLSADKPLIDSKYAKYLNFECHSICRAIQIQVPSVKVVDGDFCILKAGPGDPTIETVPVQKISVRHSWLVTPDLAIIDPYPVGCLALTPILIPSKGTDAPFAGELYVPNHETTARISGRKMLRKSRYLATFMKAT